MASTELVFANEECAGAIADVRDNNSPTNWCLFTYSESSKNAIVFVAKGNGGAEELKQSLDESKIFYGLVRVTDQIDQSVTVKFVFVIWCGEKVPFVQKGKMTTHKGSITTLMGQFHNALNCSNFDEISEEIIYGKVTDASGTASRVKETATSTTSSSTPNPTSPAPAPARTQKSSGHSGVRPGIPQGSATVVQFIDEDGIRGAIKQVRSDNDDTDWILLGYEGNTNKVVLQAKDSDGLEGLLNHLKPTEVQYGLYRTTDTVDNTVAVKFVLILWVGEGVAGPRKARITTHKGEITSFIGQYHVDCSCSNMEEINDEIIHHLVQRASGTASFVK